MTEITVVGSDGITYKIPIELSELFNKLDSLLTYLWNSDIYESHEETYADIIQVWDKLFFNSILSNVKEI